MARARAVYGNALERLFGVLSPVPAERIVALEDTGIVDLGGGRSLGSHYSPGHAKHHVGLIDSESGDLYVGDAAGVYLRILAICGLPRRRRISIWRPRSPRCENSYRCSRPACCLVITDRFPRSARRWTGRQRKSPSGWRKQPGARGGTGSGSCRGHGAGPYERPLRGVRAASRSGRRGEVRTGQQGRRQRRGHHALARQGWVLDRPCSPKFGSALLRSGIPQICRVRSCYARFVGLVSSCSSSRSCSSARSSNSMPSSSSRRSAASVSPSASAAAARANYSRASSTRPAASNASAYA